MCFELQIKENKWFLNFALQLNEFIHSIVTDYQSVLFKEMSFSACKTQRRSLTTQLLYFKDCANMKVLALIMYIEIRTGPFFASLQSNSKDSQRLERIVSDTAVSGGQENHDGGDMMIRMGQLDGDGVMGGSVGELIFMLLVVMEEVDRLIKTCG